ncbi:MAG: nucleotide exchange factor GrpE [Oscillospiraceae bacterium]
MAEKKKKPIAEEVKKPEETAIEETVIEETVIEEKASVEETLKKELDEQKEMLLRVAAEFDNFKKRTEREKLSSAQYVKAQTLKPLLPIIDNIGRAQNSDKDSADYQKGIEMIMKQFFEVSNELGLEVFAEVGDEFDPQLHEAVMHIEDEELPPNSIAQVLQRGYKIGETIIRPAMVQVAN